MVSYADLMHLWGGVTGFRWLVDLLFCGFLLMHLAWFIGRGVLLWGWMMVGWVWVGIVMLISLVSIYKGESIRISI